MQITDHSANRNYFAAYDHNGNVSALERDDGLLAAAYEYSPFGEPMRADVSASDSTMQDNPFRYSTRYTDLESGLVYYGLRYYSPILGRFINRDPIQEQGGVNLYGFVFNNPVSSLDVLGLSCDPPQTEELYREGNCIIYQVTIDCHDEGIKKEILRVCPGQNGPVVTIDTNPPPVRLDPVQVTTDPCVDPGFNPELDWAMSANGTPPIDPNTLGPNKPADPDPSGCNGDPCCIKRKNIAFARSPSGFALRAPKQMAGAIWDGLTRSRA